MNLKSCQPQITLYSTPQLALYCSKIPLTCSLELEEIKDTLEKWGLGSGSETRTLKSKLYA